GQIIVSLRPHLVVAIGYVLPAGAANFSASWCFALLISSRSLSNASGARSWPEATGRSTFTKSKRTPRISASAGSLVGPSPASRRITSRIHSPRASPCDLAKSVTLPSSSFVSFTVTGKTRFRVRSPRELLSRIVFKIAILAIHFTGALKCTENCHVLEIAESAPRCTHTTLEGVECQNSSGAKHRSCIATKLDARSRLHRPHRRRGFHPTNALLPRLLGRTIGYGFPNTQSRSDLLRLRSLQEFLKITVFRENIVQCFVDNVVSGCLDKSSVLIHLGSGRFVEPNGGANVADLVDFKQWHICSPLFVLTPSLRCCGAPDVGSRRQVRSGSALHHGRIRE